MWLTGYGYDTLPRTVGGCVKARHGRIMWLSRLLWEEGWFPIGIGYGRLSVIRQREVGFGTGRFCSPSVMGRENCVGQSEQWKGFELGWFT